MGSTGVAAAQTKRKQAPPSDQSGEQALLRKIDAQFAELTPVSSGPGAIVFEPIANGIDPTVTQFAAGCARWLQFVVGGQPEFGKTPTWTSIDQARNELDLLDLRASRLSANRIAALLGATHLAVGEVTGSPGKIQITYRLCVLVSGEPVSTITLSGDEAAIIAQLPAAATKISRAFGASNPRVPASCTAGISGLTLMGRVAWVIGKSATPEDAKALAEVAARDPAAAVLYMFSDVTHDSAAIASARRALARVAPENTIAQHTLIASHPDKMTAPPPDLDRMATAWPNNYLLYAALARCAELRRDAMGFVRLTRQGVRISPRSGRAWGRLASAYSQYGDSIRRARVAADITSAEWEKLNEAYLLWVVAAKRATELDPRLDTAWLELATAACFAGADELADEAYWKAVAISSSDLKVLSWGLEMYQPKWLGNQPKLDRVVELVSSADYSYKQDGLALADRIERLDPRYIVQAKKLRTRMAKESKEAITRNPGDVDANSAAAAVAVRTNNRGEAAERYLALARQNPNDESNLQQLAALIRDTPSASDVINLLKQAVARKPDSIRLKMVLGRAQAALKDYDGAIATYQSVPAGSVEYAMAQDGVAQGYLQTGRGDRAVEIYRSLVAQFPARATAHSQLIQALRDLKRVEEALSAAKQAKSALPNEKFIRLILSDLLQANGQHAAAVEEMRYVVARDETKQERITHGMMLANVLVAANQKDDAIKAYRAVLADSPDEVLAKTVNGLIQGLMGVQATTGQTEATTPAPTPGPSAKPLTGVAGQLFRGNELLKQYKWKEAAEVYTEALRLDPKILEAHYGLGIALDAIGKRKDALPEYKIAAEGMPGNADAQLRYGLALAFARKPAEGAIWTGRAAALAPDSLETREQHVEILLEANRFDDAIAEANAMRKRIKGYGQYYRHVATAYEALNKNDEALQTWRSGTADTSNPGWNSLCHVGLAKLLWKLGRKEEARKEAETAVRISPNFAGPQAKALLEQWK